MQPHHAVHAPHVRNRALVDCLRRAAEHRAMRDCRIQHPRQPHVDRINRLGGHFVAHVETAPRRTHELPLIRIFQLDLGGWRNFRRILGDGAERHAAAALPVGNYAPGREAFRWRHVPARRGSRDQHFPRGGAGLPQMKLRVRDRAAGARRHVAPHVLAAHVLLRGSEFGADFRPLAFKLFGDEHGEAGLRALPHLGIRDADDDRIVRADQQPNGDFRSFFGGAHRLEGNSERKRKTAANGARRPRGMIGGSGARPTP